jgi:hypothetical protein
VTYYNTFLYIHSHCQQLLLRQLGTTKTVLLKRWYDNIWGTKLPVSQKKFSATCVTAPGALDLWMECMLVSRVTITEAGI